MLYEDPWWRDDESGGGGDFPVGVLYIILFFVVLHYLNKLIKMIKEKRAEKPTERPTENSEQHTLRNEECEEREKQKQNPPHEKGMDELFDEGIYKMPDIPGHVRCGTPFLQAKREKERQAANNAHGWKDKTGHILTNEEVDLVRKYYFLYMTPVVHKMLDDDWDIKNDFEYIIGQSIFPKKPYTERQFETQFYYYMMMPIVESLIPKYFVTDRKLTENDLYTIADDILGEKDHDFAWLEQIYGIRWKGNSSAPDDTDTPEMPPPY